MILTHLVAFEFIPGAGTAAAPPSPSTFNNSTQNWLSNSMHIAFLIGVGLVMLRGLP